MLWNYFTEAGRLICLLMTLIFFNISLYSFTRCFVCHKCWCQQTYVTHKVRKRCVQILKMQHRTHSTRSAAHTPFKTTPSIVHTVNCLTCQTEHQQTIILKASVQLQVIPSCVVVSTGHSSHLTSCYYITAHAHMTLADTIGSAMAGQRAGLRSGYSACYLNSDILSTM